MENPVSPPRADLSVVVPVYNEEGILMTALAELAGYLDAIVGAGRWQYVLVNNGSQDRSQEIIDDICARWPPSKSVLLDEPDYGFALRTGLEHSDAPWAHIINVEQWDVPFLEWAWRNRDGYDLFLGSKRADPTLNHQARYRRLLSWGLNSLLSYLFEYVAIDSHGPKLLKLASLRPILAETRMNRGQFDTEFAIRALRARLWMAEAPIVYREYRPARNMMTAKIYRNIADLVRLRRVLRDVDYQGTVRFRRFCRDDVLAESSVGPGDHESILQDVTATS